MEKETNKNIQKKQVGTESYKGVRDFYPKDWLFQKWLFWQMASAAELFGYENYAASPLEHSDLYMAKSGPEIISECYNLVDKGGRNVTLRPEMTPTVARMIAAKQRELGLPIRWYSIPNLFRYEKPQRGRLREHYQFNADIFGIESIEAEVELIEMGSQILKNMKLSEKDFVIKINNRKIVNNIFAQFTTDTNTIYAISKLIDKKAKISADTFEEGVREYLGKDTESFITILNCSTLESLQDYISPDVFQNIQDLLSRLQQKGITNAQFDLTLMRGFDYYTDVVFEFFDTHEQNNRAMFGGGRYDDLLDIFGKEKIPAVGFGMGDVTARDSLEVREKKPHLLSKTKVSLLPISPDSFTWSEKLATSLRKKGINTEVDYSNRKITKKIQNVENKNIEYFVLIGEDEMHSKLYTIKNTINGETKEKLHLEELVALLQ